MNTPLPVYLRDPHAIIPLADGGFSTSLSFKDRQRLHKIVRKDHLRHFPKHMLTDYECDKLLDAFGPKVNSTLLKAAIDAKVID